MTAPAPSPSRGRKSRCRSSPRPTRLPSLPPCAPASRGLARRSRNSPWISWAPHTRGSGRGSLSGAPASARPPSPGQSWKNPALASPSTARQDKWTGQLRGHEQAVGILAPVSTGAGMHPVRQRQPWRGHRRGREGRQLPSMGPPRRDDLPYLEVTLAVDPRPGAGMRARPQRGQPHPDREFADRDLVRLLDRAPAIHWPAPRAEDLQIVASALLADLRRDRGLDDVWCPDLDGDELDALTAWKGGSLAPAAPHGREDRREPRRPRPPHAELREGGHDRGRIPDDLLLQPRSYEGLETCGSSASSPAQSAPASGGRPRACPARESASSRRAATSL